MTKHTQHHVIVSLQLAAQVQAGPVQHVHSTTRYARVYCAYTLWAPLLDAHSAKYLCHVAFLLQKSPYINVKLTLSISFVCYGDCDSIAYMNRADHYKYV